MRDERQEQTPWLASIASGFIGAVILTAIHQSARSVVTHPPRMDTVGRRAIQKTLDVTGHKTMSRPVLQKWALAGDIIANTVYYAAIAREHGRARWGRALTLGLAAGAGAIAVPPFLGLGRPPNTQFTSTRVMTTAWYMAGALATAAAASVLVPRRAAAAA